MGLFTAIIKSTIGNNGIKLEKGMSVEFTSDYGSPLSTNGGKEVIGAFLRKYGADIKKANVVSSAYIEVKRIR